MKDLSKESTYFQYVKLVRGKVNPYNYDKVQVNDKIELADGSIVECISKPNLYQNISERRWVFLLISDETGEPLMDDYTIIL